MKKANKEAGCLRSVSLRYNTMRCHVWILSTVASFVIYVNLSVIFNWPLEQLRLPRMPLAQSINDTFTIFGIFSYYETNNTELNIWGWGMDPATKRQTWRQLPTEDYFPFFRGEQASRLWASRQYHGGSQKEHWEAWQFMGQRIKERYNQEHPEDSIQQVAFEQLTWPRSVDGFYAKQTEQEIARQSWTVAE